ncbi:MAG: UDP-N-acetylmuramate:L-alanyl-gamma-D-glutamyl-meso-diaminopimelate ligase [Verrucomicrobiales bacterium]|nr:UDP-N-acetylmuramate:L-alanyl-gamma-D-glutamyl-meso-diaminopimelate ligase [Verrucomicrobiales bacterium]
MEEQKRHYHFTGICGTAMGALAVALKDCGNRVTGSDAKVYPPMSTFLADEGIAVIEGFRAENIPESAEVIVIGNAMSRGNPEVEEVLNRKLLYMSLPEVLRNTVLRGRRNIVVTGTHGKTTTSSMAAWLLKRAGRDPSHLIGGLPKNLGRGAVFTDSEFVVLEGDEYDTAFFDKRSKFVHYLPEVVVVNNIEFDHADIFDDLDAIKLSFRRMLNIVPLNGCVFANGDDVNVMDVVVGCPAPVVTVGFGEGCDRRIEVLEYGEERSVFEVGGGRYEVAMPGEYNVRNAAMAVCAGLFAGLSEEEVAVGMAEFGGVARRMDLKGEERGVKVVDDFAHHPSAIRQAVNAVRQKWPGGRVWAVFEPRSNTSRRNIFQDEFVSALGEADGVVLAAVANPEKVVEGERLDVEAVVGAIGESGKEAYCEASADAIVERLVPLVRDGDVIGVFSNGGFDGIHGKLLAALKK